MKQMLRIMPRLMAALSALLLTVLLNWQGEDSVPQQEATRQPHTAVVTPQKQHHREATLTDASQLYRICSSRPQRINPTQGGKTNRTTNMCGGVVRRHIVKPFKSFHDSRCRLETAPFCLSASRDYYVIALRHIIR